MAELSGFFESQWDESLQNPETGSNGDWDRKYLAENFADYFIELLNPSPEKLDLTRSLLIIIITVFREISLM